MRSSVKKSLLLVTTLGVAAGFAASARATAPYAGSRFADVWGQVASDRYTALPHQAVTLGSFFGFFEDKLLEASRRTLSDKSDLLPRFQKLLHPNGICLAGTWNITEETGYTGYYKKGSQGLFIARASTALTATEQGQYRAFGFAGKLFPTMDPNAQVGTANFVTIEDLGGTLRDNFLDAPNTNDIIRISITPTAFWNAGVGTAVAKAFATADNTFDVTQTLIRQLYPIAELGEPAGTAGRAPTWMQIVGAPDVVRVDATDFRDELRVQNYPGGLRFAIRTADVGTRLGDKQWKTIGYIEATEDAASDSCDHRLHFAHPQFRK